MKKSTRSSPLVLYVEDDRFWRKRAEKHLPAHGLELRPMATAEEGLELLETLGDPPRDVVVLLDLHLKQGHMQGADLLERLAARWPESPPPVIVLSVEDDFATILPMAKRFMHGTPRVIYDYQNKRYGFSDEADSVDHSYERLAHAVHVVHLEHTEGGHVLLPPFLVGISPEIRSVFRQVRVFASAGGEGANVPVLVLGETGTGKEVVAKLLHFLSPRRDRPFVAINCAAIPETLLESELFGSVRGAFTGATDREGLFESAGQGTLFLDEIGEMPPSLQAKLLRVLQEGLVRRVGEGKERQVRARIVAATNREIGVMVSAGRFREDLYYRLGMLSVSLPPLAGRVQDIELLVNSFLVKHVLLAPAVIDVDIRPVREAVSSRVYPGNVRELEGVVMKSLILASASGTGRLTAEHVREALSGRLQPVSDTGGSDLESAQRAMARLADAVLEDLVSGRRPPTSLPDIETAFGRLSLAYQVVLAVERRLERHGERRRGPTDEEAIGWFGYSGASSFRRWLAAARRSFPELAPPGRGRR